MQWIDLDRPMVVNLRQKIFTHPPGDYTLRTFDLSNEAWLQDLPADRPTLVLAEGLLCYLDPETVQKLLCDLADYLPGGQIAFDKLGSLSISLTSRVGFLKSSKSTFQWGVDEPKLIEEFHPKLMLKDCVNKKDYMVCLHCLSANIDFPTSDIFESTGWVYSNVRKVELAGLLTSPR